ncbi:uncharacterized protein LOC141680483 [Apium graveolens]|uniref:uncharacterized protein LOC141680483 n=1 Tax=Apium graveolens TaxID=4045 RepID=UPI003D7BD0A0
MLNYKLPDYSFIRVFGCLCFASVHSTDKLDPRAIKSVFLGYPSNQKGYKLLDLNTHTTFVSRHVVFHEHIFSYHLNNTSKSDSHLYSFQDWYLANPDSPTIFVNGSTPDDDSSYPSPLISNTTPSTPTVVSPVQSSTLSLTSDISNTEKDVPAHTRLSSRSTTRPKWWSDYQVDNKNKQSSLNLQPSKANVTAFLSKDPTHIALLANSVKVIEPKHYYQVVSDPLWVEAMQKELLAREQNHTWDLVQLPPDKYAIACKWVWCIR